MTVRLCAAWCSVIKDLLSATCKHSVPGTALSHGYSDWMLLDQRLVRSLRSLHQSLYMVATNAIGLSMAVLFGIKAISEAFH